MYLLLRQDKMTYITKHKQLQNKIYSVNFFQYLKFYLVTFKVVLQSFFKVAYYY